MGRCLSFHPCVGFKVKQPRSVRRRLNTLCGGAGAEGGRGWRAGPERPRLSWGSPSLCGSLLLLLSLCINVSLSFFLSCCVPSPSVSPHSILPHTPCSAWLVSVPLHLCLDACVGAAVGSVGYSSLSLHLLTLSLPSLVPEAPSSVCGGVFAGVCVCVFSFLGIFLPLSPSRCPPPSESLSFSLPAFLSVLVASVSPPLIPPWTCSLSLHPYPTFAVHIPAAKPETREPLRTRASHAREESAMTRGRLMALSRSSGKGVS